MKKVSIFCSIVMTLGIASSCGKVENSKEYQASSTVQGALREKEYSASVNICRGDGQIIFDKEKFEHGDTLTILLMPGYGSRIKVVKINNVDCTEAVQDNAVVLKNVTSDIVVGAEFETMDGYIAYISAEDASIIDGEIESVWDISFNFSVKNQHCDNAEETYEAISYINVLWNESGLYYLCYVYDGDLVYGDVCNLWVSEVYSSEPHLRDPITGEWSVVNYSTNPKDGTYAIAAAADGNNYTYTGIDVSEYWTCAAQITDFGYILEIFMPRIGKTPLTAGASIGFDVSIDYYSTGGNGRDYYANWNGYVLKDEGPSCPVQGWLTSHGYWTCPAALKEIILLPEKR